MEKLYCPYCGELIENGCDCESEAAEYEARLIDDYGTIVDDYETQINGKFIRQKIYTMDKRYFLETWYNGYRLSFHELFD